MITHLMMWYEVKEQTLVIQVTVKPNAKNTTIIAIKEQAIHIALHAKPKDNEANEELIRYLSDLFNTPKTHIILIRGKTSRYKTLKLPINQTIIEFINKNKSIIS